MIGVYLYDIFSASAGNKSSHPKDESNSITNQRNLIMEYIKSDAVLSTYTVREYIDDGISGTRFDREAFEEMMTSRDMIIMVSYSGENKQIIEFAKKLKAKSVPIIAITATQDNTLSHIANESFYVEVPNLLNPLGPRHEGLVNYFILIDFILVKYLDYHERKMTSDVR